MTFARRGGGRGTARRLGPEAPDGADRPPEPEADPRAVARTIALRMLTSSAKSRDEIERGLASKGVPDDIATELLDQFESYGWINDRAFADAWVGSRHSGRGLAGRALAQELRQRGIDDEHIAAAVDTLTPEQEEDTARTLVRRKLATMSRLDHDTRTRRLVGLLQRKGYSTGLALRIIREELDGGDDAD